MALQSAADVALLVNSANSSSERRVSPSWTIAHFKTRLEPITGIPASCQQLTLRVGSQDPVAITAADEEQTQLAAFPLQQYAELTVSDSVYYSHSIDEIAFCFTMIHVSLLFLTPILLGR